MIERSIYIFQVRGKPLHPPIPRGAGLLDKQGRFSRRKGQPFPRADSGKSNKPSEKTTINVTLWADWELGGGGTPA